MKRLSLTPQAALAAGATVVTVALTAAAFWLSYEHLHDVAAGNGLGHSPARAWAWPATVDLFIVAGELLILRAALRGKFDWFAYLLAGTGSLGSIALNVAGVGAGGEPLEYIVAAVPPVAALLAFAALMRQVHDALARVAVPGAAAPVPEAVPARTLTEYVWRETVPAGVRLLPIVAAPKALPAGAVAAEQRRPEVHAEYVPEEWHGDPDPLTARVRTDWADLLKAGGMPSVRQLRNYGIGQARAQRIRDALRGVPA